MGGVQVVDWRLQGRTLLGVGDCWALLFLVILPQ